MIGISYRSGKLIITDLEGNLEQISRPIPGKA
jgi:hypothetical protein